MSTPFLRLCGAPILFGVTAAGLVCGLVGDGARDTVSAFALGSPVLACAWYGLRRQGPATVRRRK
jgi:hypothetical protein